MRNRQSSISGSMFSSFSSRILSCLRTLPQRTNSDGNVIPNEMLPKDPEVRRDGFVSQVMPEDGAAVIFTMDELNKATSNFSPDCRIGHGGFGVVYKATLSDGREVAVKRAKKDTFALLLTAQFQIEVNVLASVEHMNLVKLIGYLDEGNERILVQEYISNGNLRQHLDCQFGIVLNLTLRLDIAIDVAHALTYLHMYAERPVIHRDVKSSNILLTTSFRAKVADFGFSRAGGYSGYEICHVTNEVKGTAGYLDPEYLKTNLLTPKSDVYSFGILLLEIVTGRKPIEQTRPPEQRTTVQWAFKKYLQRRVTEIIDPRLERTAAAITAITEVSELAFQCTAPTKQDRPTMDEVVKKLWTIRKEYQSFDMDEFNI